MHIRNKEESTVDFIYTVGFFALIVLLIVLFLEVTESK